MINKVGSHGRRIALTRPPKHIYFPVDWDKLGIKAVLLPTRRTEREKAKASKAERKKAAVGKKIISKLLGPQDCAVRPCGSGTHERGL